MYMQGTSQGAYSCRKGLKAASTPVPAEYRDMSTEAAMPTKYAGAMIDRSFILVTLRLMVKQDKCVMHHHMFGGWEFLYQARQYRR